VLDARPTLHPEDRPDADEAEAGPWVVLLLASVAVWAALVVVDRRLLVEGTFLWATVRSLYTLVLAPLAAAALVQDTRELGVDGVEVGPLKWAYAAVALVFPPVGGLYLGHRHLLLDAAADRPP
jgi:drug/metabolite transporter (DMT)-like permease